jgi:outer membrane immunogenic protein
MRFSTAIGATLVAVGIATTASAADLPRHYTKAPAYVAPAGYNWTGFYVGVNAGGIWNTDNAFGDASGFAGGGQLGYNWQGMGNPLVFGIEADIQGTSLKDSATIGAVSAEAKIPAFATIRGRIGYAWDRAMLYATGGIAFTDTKASVTGGGVTVSDDKWGTGYTLGGGLEYAFAGPWRAKIEYLYVHADSVDLTLAGVPVSTGDFNYNVIRAGLNYHF